MAVPVRSELFAEVESLARRTVMCWQRAQENRRNELRAAARALPAAHELLAIPRQRLDAAGGALPRGLKANTHAHFRRFAAAGARLTLRVLRGQMTHARDRLGNGGDRLTHATRSLLHRRRERFASLEARLQASRLANVQAQRQQIARAHERVHRLSERATRAIDTLLERLDARVIHHGQLLTALSYRGVLARGFALVRDHGGHPVHSAASVGAHARLAIEFADGNVGVTADADRPAAPVVPASPPRSAAREARRRRRAAQSADQGNLF
jgi:exodeoxyribonuclease VII large subunit